MKTVIDSEQTSSDEPFSAVLAEAVKGLIYISETDAPIEPFFCPGAKKDPGRSIGEMIGRGPGEEADTVGIDRFFERLTKDQSWHDSEHSREAERFRQLKRLLEDNLTDLQVARFGKTRIDIYVVGFDKDGDLAGIKTKAVET